MTQSETEATFQDMNVLLITANGSSEKKNTSPVYFSQEQCSEEMRENYAPTVESI